MPQVMDLWHIIYTEGDITNRNTIAYINGVGFLAAGGGVVGNVYAGAKISNVMCNVNIDDDTQVVRSGGIMGSVLGSVTVDNVYYCGSVSNTGTVGGIFGSCESADYTITCENTVGWKPQSKISTKLGCWIH